MPAARIAGALVGALGLGVSLVFSLGCLPPALTRTVFEDRTTVAQLPIAPPPPGARRDLDVSVRQAFATLVDGADTAAPAPTALPALATDGSITLRFTPFVGVRFFGIGTYGPLVGSTPSSISFPEGGTGGGGAGVVAGYWGDPSWSIHVQIDTALAIMPSHDLWRTDSRTCSGDSESSCGEWMAVGREVRTGTTAYPVAAATLDVAGVVVPWLRLGGGIAYQPLILRGLDSFDVSPVGLARLYAEVRYEDASILIEVQQPLSEVFVLGPIVAITLRAAFFDRLTGPRPPRPVRPPPPPGVGAWVPPALPTRR